MSSYCVIRCGQSSKLVEQAYGLELTKQISYGISSLGHLSFALRPFNQFDKPHPHYQGSSSLLKVNWLQILSTSTK